MKFGRSIRVAIATAAVGAMFAGGLESANAHIIEVPTNLSLTSVEPDGAKGKVSSPNAKCERGRQVTLWYVVDGPDQKIGTDRSNRQGKWNVAEPLTAGTYQATVSAKVLATSHGAASVAGGSHGKRCKKKRSRKRDG